MSLAPIVLFVYNRPSHTKQTLESLADNCLSDQSSLFIYADGPKDDATIEDKENIRQVRFLLYSKRWCKRVEIVEREKNWGLANNIVSGVTNVINKHGKVIVLEDDIVTSPGFLQYMNDALSLYQDEDKVMHISGYMIPLALDNLPSTFFYNQTSCWGWGTWKQAWKSFEPNASLLKAELDSMDSIHHFNLDGCYNFYNDLVKNIKKEIETWAIKWHASVYINGGLCLHPHTSLVSNIGFDGSGVHCGENNSFRTEMVENVCVEAIESLSEDVKVRQKVVAFYRSRKRKNSLYGRVKNKIWSILHSQIEKLILKKRFPLNG